MIKTSIEKICENPNLVTFCNKILVYNEIFNNEISRSMFFVSLISADILVDKQSCEETIETAIFILNNIDLFIIDDDIKRMVIHYSNNAIEIASAELNKMI